jgi:hypothetical protein
MMNKSKVMSSATTITFLLMIVMLSHYDGVVGRLLIDSQQFEGSNETHDAVLDLSTDTIFDVINISMYNDATNNNINSSDSSNKNDNNNMNKTNVTSNGDNNNNNSKSSENNKDDAFEVVAFLLWYVFLVFCCVVPTCCAYRRRRLLEQRLENHHTDNMNRIMQQHEALFVLPHHVQQQQQLQLLQSRMQSQDTNNGGSSSSMVNGTNLFAYSFPTLPPVMMDSETLLAERCRIFTDELKATTMVRTVLILVSMLACVCFDILWWLKYVRDFNDFQS